MSNRGDKRNRSLPSNPEELRAVTRIGYLRQASAWASVVWFPAILVLFSINQQAVAIAGTSFSGVLRGIVALSRCPRCDNLYSLVSGGYQEYGNPTGAHRAALPAMRISHSAYP